MVQKNDILTVTGLTGVGKDYLIDRSVDTQNYLSVVNFGTLISKELAMDRDHIATAVETDTIRKAQLAVAAKIINMQPVVLSSHVVTHANGVYHHNEELEATLDPQAYVFVTAPPALILERVRERNKKGQRQSTELAVDEIAGVQQTKLDTVKRIADKQGTEIVTLVNLDENVAENVAALSRLIGALSTRGFNEDLS